MARWLASTRMTRSSIRTPGAIHYLNVGSEEFPYHPHGNNGLVIGRDGHALEGPTGQDLSFEKFAINIGPGQTWDVLFKWHDAENYSEANPVPVVIPQVNNQEFGMFYSGSPYLGADRHRCRPARRRSTSAARTTSFRTTTRCTRSPPGA